MLQSLINDFRRRTADESAASAIELAIVLPILLLAALALVDMAFFVVNWTGTNAGATSAARTIVVTPDATQADLKAAVLSDAPQLAASDFEVNVTWAEEKSQGYTHHFPNKTATEFVSKQRYVVTQDVTVTVTAKRPYLTVLGKAWGQNAGTGDDMVATSSCTMSVDRTNGTNWVGEDNYVPGIRWTLEDGVLTVMPEEGYSWGVGIKDGVSAGYSTLSDWVTLTGDEWKTVTEIDFEGSVAFGDSKGNRYCPRIGGSGTESTLVKADLSSWDSSNVTDMRNMFYGCSALTSLDVSNFDTSKVTNMYDMFYNCSSLTTIYVGNEWSTNKVTKSSYMFQGDTKLVGAVSYNSSKVDASMANWETGYLTYAQRQNGGTFATKFAVQPAESREVSDVTKIALIERDGTELISDRVAEDQYVQLSCTLAFQGIGPNYAKELGFAITCKMSDGNTVTFNSFDGIPEKVVSECVRKISGNRFSNFADYADMVNSSGLNLANFKVWPNRRQTSSELLYLEDEQERGWLLELVLKVE